MPKVKTRKTLTKRIKITKGGKVMKKQNRMGHLKYKLSSSRKHRKSKLALQTEKGQTKVLKRLLGARGAKIK
jgi:ribosomal protein L35